MKKTYTNPTLDIENVVVEEGIATSPLYGNMGEPGQDSDLIEGGEDW